MHISGMGEAINFKFRSHINHALTKKCKIRSKGVGKRACDLLLEFWDSLCITRIVETRNFIFGMQIGHDGY